MTNARHNAAGPDGTATSRPAEPTTGLLDGLLNRQFPAVMGIVNVTPDSFSDGGRFLEPTAAIGHARRLAEDGADILDIGAEFDTALYRCGACLAR